MQTQFLGPALNGIQVIGWLLTVCCPGMKIFEFSGFQWIVNKSGWITLSSAKKWEGHQGCFYKKQTFSTVWSQTVVVVLHSLTIDRLTRE